MQIQIDGVPAMAEDLGGVILSGYGAFSVMQVEDGAVRALDLHLARLRDEAVELFGRAVPDDLMRRRMAQAVGGLGGRWTLRVNLFSDAISLRDPAQVVQPRVLTTVSPAALPLSRPPRLQTQIYGREVAHLKHTATLGLTRARRMAVQAGYDDALFVDADGRISEGSIWNIGFISGERVVWPQAPMLMGTGQGLLQRGLATQGVGQTTQPVHLDDLPRFEAAFLCNSATPVCAIAAIDGRGFEIAHPMFERLYQAWASQPPIPLIDGSD